MLRYYYTKENDKLYVYDNENDFLKLFDSYTGEWFTPISSFMQIDHDNDDLAVISEEMAKALSNGASFEKEYSEYLSLIALGKSQG